MGSKVIQRNLTGIFLYSSNAINNKSLKKKKEDWCSKTKYSRIRLLKRPTVKPHVLVLHEIASSNYNFPFPLCLPFTTQIRAHLFSFPWCNETPTHSSYFSKKITIKYTLNELRISRLTKNVSPRYGTLTQHWRWWNISKYFSLYLTYPLQKEKRNEIEGGNDGPRRERVNLH